MPRGRRLFLLSIFAGGLGVAAFSSWWLWHDQYVYHLHETARAIREGRPVTSRDVATAFGRAITMDRQHQLTPSDLDDAGLVATVFAERNLKNPFVKQLLATAEDLLRERLSFAPADGNSWLRLAFVHAARLKLDPLAHASLRMSWLVTPREFPVMWPGLRFRMDHWADMNDAERDAAADLAAGIWHKPPARSDILAYVQRLSPDRRQDLLAHMTDPQARMGLTATR